MSFLLGQNVSFFMIPYFEMELDQRTPWDCKINFTVIFEAKFLTLCSTIPFPFFMAVCLVKRTEISCFMFLFEH